MKVIDKLKYRLNNPKRLKKDLLYHISPYIKDDKLYIKLLWAATMDYKLHLDNPQTFNEKLQWLKLFDHNPEYVKMVDKFLVKDYVSGIIGDSHIIPTLGVWDKPEDIEWEKLPKQFVLKCTHDSGGVLICKDKNTFDINQAISFLNNRLKMDFYCLGREWPYKHVSPRIIAETFVENGNESDLHDYKFFCFNGTPKALFIASDRGSADKETKFDFYDMDFNVLPFTNGHPHSDNPISKPKHFEEMKSLASKLSQGIPHVRVDFYEVGDKVLFGELTFYHWGGFVPFEPRDWDYKFGEWIVLPEI